MSWRPRFFVHLLFLVSGATGLVYQVSWVRDLSLIFGASHQAISVVLAAFMTGLSLGGLYFGRRAFRRFDPLRLYGLLELGVAACAILLPLVYRLIDLVYVSIAVRVEGVPWTLTLLRIAMAFVALVVPTFFMGGTLPVLTRFLVQRYGEFGVRVASLYGINTVGAVGGVVVTTFVLLPWIGVWRSQLVAAAVNACIGVAAFLVQRQLARVSAVAATSKMPQLRRGRRRQRAAATKLPAPAPVAAGHVVQSEDPPRHIWALRLTFWGTAVSGLAALGLEVMWSRGISITSGTSIYSFAIMLVAFLSGIALGSWLHAILPLRHVHEAVQFAIAFIGAGLCSVVVSQWIPQLPDTALRWNLHFYGNGVAVGPKTTSFMAFAIMLLPCVFMGLAFPLSGQANARLARNFGRSIGDTIAVNTGAAIIGSLLAGFVLIPSVGLQRGMLLLSTLYLAYGFLVLGFTLDFQRPLLRWAGRGLALAGLVAACTIPVRARPWDLQALGAFRNSALRTYVDPQGRNVLRGELERSHVLYYEEGRGSTVSVVELDDRRTFVVNGKTEAGDVATDLHHELLLGHLPALLHPAPKSAMVLGLGAGITLGGVAAHPGIERIDLVEIEPAVFGVAEVFADVNDNALHNRRVHAYHQDGRNFLLTTRATYDIITADPIHPWAQGAAYLYTAEYYRILAKRLNPGGIMCQWFPLYDFSERDIRSVAATFVQNFPYTTLWHTTFDAILIGSNAPIGVDVPALAQRMQEPSVVRQLARVGLEKPLSFLAEFAMDDAALRRFAAGGVVNTDDNVYLEFSSPVSLLHYDWLANLTRLQAQRSSPLAILRNTSGFDPDVEALRRRVEDYARAKTETVAAAVAIQAGSPADVEAASKRLREIARVLPDYGLPRRYSCQGWGRLAVIELRAGAADSAAAAARAALELCPDDGEAHRLLGIALSAQGRQEEAAAEYRESLRFRPRHVGTRANLETALVGLGADTEVVSVLRTGHALVPYSSELATRLAWRLATLPNAAVRDGAEALRVAREACSLPAPHPRRAATLAALAAAEAEVGRFADATATANSALELAERDKQEVTAQLLRDCLAAFAAGRPFRHGPVSSVTVPSGVQPSLR